MSLYKTHIVKVAELKIGGKEKIALQSMTNTATLDVEATTNQCVDIIKKGADLVRISAKNKKELFAIKKIKSNLNSLGYNIPIIADIHFSSSLAIDAGAVVDKVRINPGNFYPEKEMTDDEYFENIKKNLKPLIDICKENKTAIRIGTNHGSLSPRIMNRYGKGAEAMTEATMEFVKIVSDLGFKDVILSVKASDVLENIKTAKLLVGRLQKEGYTYPIHLGVTEAGLGFSGRINSAVGIGVLIADGIGNTIRVSLTESPEKEIPVARDIVNMFSPNNEQLMNIEPFEKAVESNKKSNNSLKNGNSNFTVICSKKHTLNKLFNPDLFSEELMKDKKYIIVNKTNVKSVNKNKNNIFIIETKGKNSLYDFRTIYIELCSLVDNPHIIWKSILADNKNETMYRFGSELGSLLASKSIKTCWVEGSDVVVKDSLDIVFEVLQMFGIRLTHADFVSCPSCNRTSFDILNLAEKVRKETYHLIGKKIAVMGCIVNGPGEMGDADYGLVGQSKGEVALYYKGKQIKKNIDETKAVEKLIELIKINGDWEINNE